MKSNKDLHGTIATLLVVGFLLIGYTVGGDTVVKHKRFSNEHVYTTHKDTLKTNNNEDISSSN